MRDGEVAKFTIQEAGRAAERDSYRLEDGLLPADVWPNVVGLTLLLPEALASCTPIALTPSPELSRINLHAGEGNSDMGRGVGKSGSQLALKKTKHIQGTRQRRNGPRGQPNLRRASPVASASSNESALPAGDTASRRCRPLRKRSVDMGKYAARPFEKF